MYGLNEKEFYQIISIIERYGEKIESVKLFGSRARGDFKNVSDIDLAIIFRESSIFLKIKNDFYESDLKYSVDIINYDEKIGGNLKENIEKEGVLIYKTDERGRILMSENKLKNKLEDFQKSLLKLDKALEKDVHLDELYLDATIQRFEFVYELSWKLLKNYLEYEGLEVTSPRESFREGFKLGLIEDATKWIELMINRNRTSHTYNEESAWEIYEKVKSEYIFMFREFEKIMVERIKRESEKGNGKAMR